MSHPLSPAQLKLTPTQYRGLRVVRDANAADMPALPSNRTDEPGRGVGVHMGTLRALERLGLVSEDTYGCFYVTRDGKARLLDL